MVGADTTGVGVVVYPLFLSIGPLAEDGKGGRQVHGSMFGLRSVARIKRRLGQQGLGKREVRTSLVGRHEVQTSLVSYKRFVQERHG